MGLIQVDSSVNGNTQLANTAITVALTNTNGNDVIIVCASIHGSGSAISSITASPALTFTKYAAYSGPSSTNPFLETWYAVTGATAFSGNITITPNSSEKLMSVVVFSISNANTSTPFDNNSSLPAEATGSAAGNMTVSGISTSNANDMIIAFNGTVASPTITFPTGYTAIQPGLTKETDNVGYKIVTSTQTNISVTFQQNTANNWNMMVFAIQQASGAVAATPSVILTPQTLPTTRAVLVNGNVVFEGYIESKTTLAASASFVSPLLMLTSSQSAYINVYSMADKVGTLYLIFTDSTGGEAIKIQPTSSGQATADPGTPPSGSGIDHQNTATIKSQAYSQYFIIVYANSTTANTIFEVGWHASTS